MIYNTLSMSYKRVVIVLSPLASNSCGRSQIIILLSLFAFTCTYLHDSQIQIQGGISLLPYKKKHREGNLQNLEWSTTSKAYKYL